MDMPAATQPSRDTPRELPLDAISIQPGFNPRRAFRSEPLARLVDSIRNEGLACPIAVRPRDDGEAGYWLIAGERRLRAFRELGETTIPVLVRECDEAAAKRIALVENLDRADLSPAEEAIAARDWVAQCGGRPTCRRFATWLAHREGSRPPAAADVLGGGAAGRG